LKRASRRKERRPSPQHRRSTYDERDVEELRSAPFVRAFRERVDYDRLCDEVVRVVRERM